MSYHHLSYKKFKIILSFIIVLLMCFLAACQQTPEKEVVVNRGSSSLDELVLEKADQGESWTQIEDRIVWDVTKNVDTEIGECSITVSMDVEMPKYPGPVPVYLIEPGEFSFDFLEFAAKHLMTGEIYDGQPSKQDVAAEILSAKKFISEHTVLDGYQTDLDDYYNFLDEKYNNAPENNSEAKFEFTENDYGQNGLQVKSYLDDNSIENFSSLSDETGKSDNFTFHVNEFQKSFYKLNEISAENIQAEGAEITYTQALAAADNTMTALFEEPFVMMHTDVIDKINHLEYLWNDGDVTSLGQAYVFNYFREYDGFTSLYINPPSTIMNEKTEYAKPYIREYAVIVVDDRGVVYMKYDSYSDTVEKLNEDVGLMPFEQILERFKDDVFHHYLWGRSAEITITQIEFGMVREPVKDNPNQYMMIPAWNFIGDFKTNLFGDDTFEQCGKSILVLNAIDGGIVTDYETICDPK